MPSGLSVENNEDQQQLDLAIMYFEMDNKKRAISILNNIINKITLNWKTNYKIILTGGYAKFFKKIIKKNTLVDQNITIKGVSRVYRELL